MSPKFLSHSVIKDIIINFFTYGVTSNTLRLEASSMCQLKCPICFHAKPRTDILGNGYLKYVDFKYFVDTYPTFKQFELSNFGEIFLNPDLKKIIEYAHIKNLRLMAQNGVSLNTIDEETTEALVKYKFKAITVSIDGATNETYQIYRKGGDFNKVIANIKKINEYKKKHRTDLPRMIWQFIVFGHNEHEIPAARAMARELNMSFTLKSNWNKKYSPVKNTEIAKKEMGGVSREDIRKNQDKMFMFSCKQFWENPQINWDGKLLGCCVNLTVDFGNVFESGLRECLRSEKYNYTKQMICGKKGPREDIPCSSCSIYREMSSKQTFFKPPRFIDIIKKIKLP